MPAIQYCAQPGCELYGVREPVHPDLWLYDGEVIVCGVCGLPIAIEHAELIPRRAAPDGLFINRAVGDD